MTPLLDRLVFVAKDVAEQGPSQYVLFVQDPLSVSAFAVDGVRTTEDGVATGYHGNVDVIRFPISASWALYDRSLFDVVTRRDHYTAKKAEDAEFKAFSSSLYPEETAKITGEREHPGFCV